MRDFLRVYWPLILLAVAGIIVALRFVEPAPPGSIRFAAGSPGGAYTAYAERYRERLAEHGVTVEIVNTNGSVENLGLLHAGEVDAALLQGGLAGDTDGADLRSLGGLFYEPFWVFVRTDYPAQNFDDLRTARMAIGTPGSGTRALADKVQAEFGGAWPEGARQDRSGAEAAEALLQGDLDAAVFTAGISAPYVQQLLTAPDVRVLPFVRAPALSRRQPALAEATLLRGVVDIGRDLPAQDIPMIAPVAQLAVNEDLHPAIQSILLEAAAGIHAPQSAFAQAGRFPDGRANDLPLSSEADRYYRRGPSFLRQYFPFSVANFLERAWVLAIPLLTLLVPLVRAAPPVYRWQVRRKIYIWYRDLRDLEARGRAATSQAELDAVRHGLRRLQEEIGKLQVPLSYTDDVYRLRNHVAFVNHMLGNLDPEQAINPVHGAAET